ncbi:MAG: hypothetical protein LUE98_13975 [Tannerellaceae bacterium]|nr:hypothetical protein [Tannerellaceae bacterium]
MEVESARLTNQNITIKNIHLNPAYQKEYFAYLHPQHEDWFDVTAEKIEIQNIDFLTWFYKDSLNIQKVTIDNPVLQNYKNKKYLPHPGGCP